MLLIQRNATERNQAIAKTIDVSLRLLTREERARYLELAIFPEDTDIPLSTVSALWRHKAFKTLRQCEMLENLSLLKLDPQTLTIRLHDVIRSYVANQLSEPAALHAKVLDERNNFLHYRSTTAK